MVRSLLVLPLGVLGLGLALVALAGTDAVRAEDQADGGHVLERADALLAAVVPHVEAVCGAAFPEPPRVRRLAPEQAEAVFRADLAAEVERRYPQATEGQRRTILAASARASVASCLARYSFRARAIIVVTEGFDAQRAAAGIAPEDAESLLSAVLAHEAVHALDDARFGLAALYASAPDAEALRARSMVAEGRAVLLGRRAAEAAGVHGPALDVLPGGDAPRDVHAWTLRLTYEAGAAFVAALEARGGRELAEQALRTPPATTHRVFHPNGWPDTAPDGRPRARLVDSGVAAAPDVLSELQLRARYAALHDGSVAVRLFAGFRGGAQALVDGTNVAVLAFEDETAARDYVRVAGDEAPTRREGSLVLRAFGDRAEALLRALAPAAETTPAQDRGE